VAQPGAEELWRTIPLDDDFLLISRRGTSLTPEQRRAVLQILQSGSPSPQTRHSSRRETF
jgi:hypothetical protein